VTENQNRSTNSKGSQFTVCSFADDTDGWADGLVPAASGDNFYFVQTYC